MIMDVHPGYGSRIRIPDPDLYFLPIADPGSLRSRIPQIPDPPDPGSPRSRIQNSKRHRILDPRQWSLFWETLAKNAAMTLLCREHLKPWSFVLYSRNLGLLATTVYNFTWHPEAGPGQDAAPQRASRRRDSRWRGSGRHARRCPAGRVRPAAQKESGGAGASGRCNQLSRSPRRRRTDPSQHHSCPG